MNYLDFLRKKFDTASHFVKNILPKMPDRYQKVDIKTKSGKRKRIYIQKERSSKSPLEKMHFGTFSPIKKF